MNLVDILGPGCVACHADVKSRKRALERVATLLAAARPSLTGSEILTALLARERIGSTTIGNGIAIPRARLSGLQAPAAAVVRLDEGVAFDAADHVPIDLLVGCIFPGAANDEEQRRFIDQLSQMLTRPETGERLRAADDDRALYDALRALDVESNPI